MVPWCHAGVLSALCLFQEWRRRRGPGGRRCSPTTTTPSFRFAPSLIEGVCAVRDHPHPHDHPLHRPTPSTPSLARRVRGGGGGMSGRARKDLRGWGKGLILCHRTLARSHAFVAHTPAPHTHADTCTCSASPSPTHIYHREQGKTRDLSSFIHPGQRPHRPKSNTHTLSTMTDEDKVRTSPRPLSLASTHPPIHPQQQQKTGPDAFRPPEILGGRRR